MIKLKKNEPIRYNGIYYDFTMLDEHKLQRIYDNNPLLRHFFEIEPIDELDEFLTKNKPEGKTEEEFFNETVEEIVKIRQSLEKEARPVRKRIKRK